MTLNELEALADAAINCPYPNAPWMTAVIDYRYAANPQTIKQLIALCRLQNRALKLASCGLLELSPCAHDECKQIQTETLDISLCKTKEAIAAFDAFQEGMR